MLFRTEWDHLLVAARDGDAQALGRLVEVAGEDLRTTAAGVIGRSTQTRLPIEDVFAEAMTAALREIGSLRATNYVGFRFWFATIARNHVRKTLRKERMRPDLVAERELEPDDDEEFLELSAESLDFLRLALLRLPRSQQVAFILRQGLALTWRTIGFVLARREAPAARLIHYRAALGVKDLASTRPELRIGATQIRA